MIAISKPSIFWIWSFVYHHHHHHHHQRISHQHQHPWRCSTCVDPIAERKKKRSVNDLQTHTHTHTHRYTSSESIKIFPNLEEKCWWSCLCSSVESHGEAPWSPCHREKLLDHLVMETSFMITLSRCHVTVKQLQDHLWHSFSSCTFFLLPPVGAVLFDNLLVILKWVP